METINFRSHVTIRLVTVGLLFSGLSVTKMTAREIKPVGTKINAVQFDAIIELNRYSPDSVWNGCTVIFARYWVAGDYYSASIVWAEPQSTDLVFTVTPPTLSIVSYGKELKFHHELVTKYNGPYTKPLGQRGVFRYKLGSYPIDNIRFAEQEAKLTRIYTSYLGNLKEISQIDGEMLEIPGTTAEDADYGNVDRLKVTTGGQDIHSLQLFDAKSQLLSFCCGKAQK